MWRRILIVLAALSSLVDYLVQRAQRRRREGIERDRDEQIDRIDNDPAGAFVEHFGVPQDSDAVPDTGTCETNATRDPAE